MRYSILVIAICFTFFSCKTESKNTIKTTTIIFHKEGDLVIYRAETDSILSKVSIEIAETDYETQTGLMYRKSMQPNEGMLFIFSDVRMHSFYMKNTEIPLDIVFIDEDLKIASFQKNTKPLDETGLSSQVPVKYVLELNAGLSEKWLLEVGDQIEYSTQKE